MSLLNVLLDIGASQVHVIEAPVEDLLAGLDLVNIVAREVAVPEALLRRVPGFLVVVQHVIQQVERCRISLGEQVRPLHAPPGGKALNELESLLVDLLLKAFLNVRLAQDRDDELNLLKIMLA